MLENETERLIRNVEARTIGKNQSVSMREILAAEVPHPLKVFFRSDVERILNDELRRTRTHSRFDYSNGEVEALQRKMNSILVLNFSFLREEFLQKVDDGVHLVLNLLVRPQWTLTSFIFHTNASASVSDVKSMLAYFGGHEYLKEILLRYIDEKRLESLTMNELQNLLLRIDGEYIRRKEGSELARMTGPIYEFINFSTPPAAPAPHAIPVQTKVFVKFFEDKRLRLICEVLEQHIAQRGVNELTMDQLGEILEQVRRTNDEAFIPDETFTKKQSALGVAPESPPVVETAEARNERPSSSQSFERQQLIQPVREKRAGLPDLNEIISNRDRRRIIKKIFRRDDAQYSAILKALNAMASWKDASVYIDKLFIANEVDPYSRDAVRFLELVQQRFTSRNASP